jgi:8-oxo-dGTP pyrophosphatase MutT (NUDIX family)
MPTPEFVIGLRKRIGHEPLWLATAAGIVLDEDRRLLLGRRADTGRWAIPGGIVDPGEEPADCAVREIFEETGVIAVPERLVETGISRPITYPNGDQVQYLELTFRCRAVGGQARVNDPESVEVAWFSLDSLPEMHGYSTRVITTDALEGEGPAAFRFSGLEEVLGHGALNSEASGTDRAARSGAGPG